MRHFLSLRAQRGNPVFLFALASPLAMTAEEIDGHDAACGK